MDSQKPAGQTAGDAIEAGRSKQFRSPIFRRLHTFPGASRFAAA
ncbi:hypothetical protein [uncultured Bosea sp.]|nr:hypothetical protein [uncultured Bosea sp.]